jgi:hypothetical protein
MQNKIIKNQLTEYSQLLLASTTAEGAEKLHEYTRQIINKNIPSIDTTELKILVNLLCLLLLQLLLSLLFDLKLIINLYQLVLSGRTS